MNKKERIRQLKKNNEQFAKGSLWIKGTAVLSLCCIIGVHVSLFLLSGTVYEASIVNMAVQIVMALLILSGNAVFPLLYGAAMLVSFGAGMWLYLQSQSVFYLVQCVFFFLSFLMMACILLNQNVKVYRNELKKRKEDESLSEITEKENEEMPVIQQETVEENVPAFQHIVEVDCPLHTDTSYGSFSRFLMLHYPFVYLHPQFSLNYHRIQMCISAEGFEQQGSDMYSGTFTLSQLTSEQVLHLKFEAEDEMSYLCALICADWLVSQKGTLVENGINISADLMKKLTEAFVLARDSQKQPFEGFQHL